MNGIQKGKSRNLKEPFPGCLGRMVNLFDLNIGVPGNKLLTENPYQDGKVPNLFSKSLLPHSGMQ